MNARKVMLVTIGVFAVALITEAARAPNKEFVAATAGRDQPETRGDTRADQEDGEKADQYADALLDGGCSGGGCTAGTNLYPGGLFTTTSSSWTTFMTCGYAGEHTRFWVGEGAIYEWSSCAGDGAASCTWDSQFMLRTTSGSNICYDDDWCTDYKSKIRWTATFTGEVHLARMEYPCGTNTDCATFVWRRVTAPCPGSSTTCGDGEVCPTTESCDDGYADGCGSCNATCTGSGSGSTCGDGVVCPETESCDDGYTDACGSCNADCTGPGTGSTCGDGVVCPESEMCDDGGTDACGSCNASCTGSGSGSTCGDGQRCPDTEECDDGYTDACGSCNADCTGSGSGVIPPNGGFEADAVGTTFSAITDWDHSSTGAILAEDLEIVDDYYLSGSQSVYTLLRSGGGLNNTGYQYLSTENPVSTTADYVTVWIGGEGYTTSSRYSWRVRIKLTDGTNNYTEYLRCDCWGNNEGCTPNHYDYYDATTTGADGTTWKRYTRAIPAELDKSSLTVEIQHTQVSWDWTQATSWYRVDGIYFSDSGGNPIASVPECGDGDWCPETEWCDDGYTGACGSCNADCTGPGTGSTCGDGVVCSETEQCDDGGTDACGSCNADCTGPGSGSTCGDGVLCP